MAIKKYRHTKLHLAASFILAVLGVGLIISAMFIPQKVTSTQLY